MTEQSDQLKLRENIYNLTKATTGVYSFFWAHPIKFPKKASSNEAAMFWDRRNDEWIVLKPVIHSPSMEDFDMKNISELPNEEDYYLLVGSFNVNFLKTIDGWSIKVDVIV